MVQMTITLTPELERLVKEKVALGEYDSADAFVGETVQRLVEEEKEEDAHRTRFWPESKLQKRRSTAATTGNTTRKLSASWRMMFTSAAEEASR